MMFSGPGMARSKQQNLRNKVNGEDNFEFFSSAIIHTKFVPPS